MPTSDFSRRYFLRDAVCVGLSAAASTLGCAGPQRSRASKQKHPNLLFVFADQMRGDEMACMGHPMVRTPNLDAMARDGVLFENATSCCPVCTPYRASLLSGRYPLSTGMFLNDLRLPTNLSTIGVSLRDAGYRTGYIGKWHLDGPARGGFTPPGPRRQGFDDFWAVANCNHNYMKAFLFRDDPEPIWLDGYEPDVHTDLAIEFLNSSPRNQPFCLFLSLGTPHNPYELMPDSYRIYDPDDVQPRPNCPDPPRKDLAGYDAHITALDRNLGRLFTTLESRGLSEETLCVFTSDHGDMLGSHGQQRKQRPWDESVRVPLLIRQPGRVPAGLRSQAVTNSPDLMPTLLSLCGVEIPSEVEGEDLSQVWLGRSAEALSSAFIADYISFAEAKDFPEWRGVRTQRHTFVCTREGPWMLFDNKEDPYQMRNLLDTTEGPQIAKPLQCELDRWMDRTADTFEKPEVYLERFKYTVDEKWKHILYTTEVGAPS
ncbi:MAG: sulfatase [bacterium]